MNLLAQLDPNHVKEVVANLQRTGRVTVHYSDGTETIKENGTKKSASNKAVVSNSSRIFSKTDIARELLFKLQKQGKSRQEIIETFVEKIGLTKAGASTYYYNLTKEK